MWSFFTAEMASQPGRERILSLFTLTPHHEATMISGSREMTADGSTILSLPDFAKRSSGKIGSPPAISMSSSTQRMPLISGSFHSSKRTRGLFEFRPDRTQDATRVVVLCPGLRRYWQRSEPCPESLERFVD